MDTTKCDGRHRARKHCLDPECYLKDAVHPLASVAPLPGSEEDEDRGALRKLYDGADNLVATELPPITDADNLAAELPWHPEDHGGQDQPSEDPRHEPMDIDAAPPGERPPTIDEQVAGFVARDAEPQPGDPEWWAFALDNPGRAKEIVRGNAMASVAEMDALNARATMADMAEHPIEFGPGIYRWACTRDGGYQRTEYAHELPPCPAGWRWSSAQVTAVGGRGKLHVSAAVVDGSEGANAATGPQSLVLEITGRGGYCTGLDVVLFARPAEVRR